MYTIRQIIVEYRTRLAQLDWSQAGSAERYAMILSAIKRLEAELISL